MPKLFISNILQFHILVQPVAVTTNPSVNSGQTCVCTIFGTIGYNTFDDHSSGSKLVHKRTARITLARVLASFDGADMCLIHTEGIPTPVRRPECNVDIAFCVKIVFIHCKSPTGDNHMAVHRRFRYTIASEGQANGFHFGTKLDGSVQTNKRNVMDNTEEGTFVAAVRYYLLNAEQLIKSTIYSAIITYVSILIKLSQSYAGSVDETIAFGNAANLGRSTPNSQSSSCFIRSSRNTMSSRQHIPSVNHRTATESIRRILQFGQPAILVWCNQHATNNLRLRIHWRGTAISWKFRIYTRWYVLSIWWTTKHASITTSGQWPGHVKWMTIEPACANTNFPFVC